MVRMTLIAMLSLVASLGFAAGMRDDLHGAASLVACEARKEQLQDEVLALRAQLADALSQLHAQKARAKQSSISPSALELAVAGGEMLVPSADVMQVLGDISSQLAVKKEEAAVQEQAASIAKMMAEQAVEAHKAAGEVMDEKEKEFNKLLEEYEKAEEAAEKQLEKAEEEMEEAKQKAVEAIGAADAKVNEAEKAVKHASGTLKLSTKVLETKQPELEETIKKASEQLKSLTAQKSADEATLEDAKKHRDTMTEDLQKTKTTQDAKTQAALAEYASVEEKWSQEIEVLSDKVDAAERKLSEAARSETAAHSVSGKLELMKAEKEKEHKKAVRALQLFTMGTEEMKTYQANVDQLYKHVTNCERKWFKGGLRSKLMDEDSITAEDVSSASKLQKPRSKDEESVATTMKDFFAKMTALKVDTTVFGDNFPNFTQPMTTTFSAVQTETMKLANMACKYWAVTKGGETTASNGDACNLFVQGECAGKC